MNTVSFDLGKPLQDPFAIGQIPVYELSEPKLVNLYEASIKRALDFGISMIGFLIIFPWLTPILYILIKTSSKGPLFFVQKRVGKNGRIFNCWKFRTMKEDGLNVTRIGWLLRRSHIDELPQLINIMEGSMSLVGPRPHMISDHERFSALIQHYDLRHQIRPGLTGLAQSYGYHGSTPDFKSIENRTRLDLHYATKITLGVDFQILLRTLKMSLPVFKNNRRK